MMYEVFWFVNNTKEMIAFQIIDYLISFVYTSDILENQRRILFTFSNHFNRNFNYEMIYVD